MKPAVALTDAMVARARVVGVAETTLRDALVPGLALRLRASGARTWVFRHTVDGRQRRTVLGGSDALTLVDARAAARAILLGPSGGRPDWRAPVAESFARFIDRYRERAASKWKPSTRRTWELGLSKRLLPAFGARPMNRISAQEVARWFHDCSRETPGRANKLLDDLRAMLNRAREWKVIDADAPDPCALVRRNRRPPRWRLLSVDELARLGFALDGLAAVLPDETDVIRLILLTGCRSGEILRLDWSEVAGDRLELADSKTGPRSVALPEAARAILKARRPRRLGGPVFPDSRDRASPRRNIDAAWAMVKARAGLPATIRLHDLRHTYASHALMRGETLQMAGKLLGHRRLQSTERYAHLDDGFLLAAAERVSARIATLMG